jgi:hypothetical protein
MDRFLKDHAWGGYWYRPHKLRKIRYTDADIALLLEARNAAQEAGRRRMVARGLWQYAQAGELTLEQAKRWVAEGKRLPDEVLKEHGLVGPSYS